MPLARDSGRQKNPQKALRRKPKTPKKLNTQKSIMRTHPGPGEPEDRLDAPLEILDVLYLVVGPEHGGPRGLSGMREEAGNHPQVSNFI